MLLLFAEIKQFCKYNRILAIENIMSYNSNTFLLQFHCINTMSGKFHRDHRALALDSPPVKS